MKAEALLALYERVADAPDSIARLRRFVLDLAVRGKLVEQDSGDEPASELLCRIHQAKSQLINDGRIRRPRDLGLAEATAPKFHVPPSWRWVRLDAVGAIVGGGTPSASDLENFTQPGNGVPWLTPADLGGHRDRYIARGSRDLTEQGLASSSATLMPKGTVLFTSRAPIGYVAIAENALATNQGFKSVVPYLTGLAEFIALVLTAFAPDIDAAAPGTTFKEVSGKIVAGVAFPLPPLAEQHRIVAKVDELMALLDRLEAARSAREATRDRLTTATLARLTAPDTDAETVPTHARFALDALPALTARVDQIKQLHRAIIELAISGRLDSADVGHNEHQFASSQPYPLPMNWIWTRAQDACEAIVDCPHSTPKFEPQGVPCIDTTCFKEGQLTINKIRYVSEETWSARTIRLAPRSGDVIFAREGSVGESVVIPEEFRCCLGQRVMLFRPGPLLTSRFLQLAISAPSSVSRLVELHKGIGAKHVNVRDMRAALLPLPPLLVQHRIVAKVDELMGLCDRLEAALQSADNARASLLEALLHEALASDSTERKAA